MKGKDRIRLRPIPVPCQRLHLSQAILERSVPADLIRPEDVEDVAQEVFLRLYFSLDQLRTAGVKFEICNNTLKGMDIDWHGLYEVHESDIVSAGFLEVGWLANQGWAVEAMN